MEKQVVNLTIFLIKEHITDLKDCLKAPDTLSSSNIKQEYGMEGTIFYCDSKRKPPRWKAYVDYRTFLEYDIVVENVITGMSVPLSQVSGDSSGGENQAPFYVAICASLLQIYRQSPNSIRLVLLDEAFNNMTSDRIEPMMKMFKAAHLQLVLISTVEKCSAIYPYCDVIYSIIKTGSRAVLAPFEKLYEGTETQ